MTAQLDRVERTLATLVEFADVHRQHLTKIDESLLMLTQKVDMLSDNISRLEQTSGRILQAIEADREVAKIQSQNVQQMVQLANTLIQKLAAA